MSTYFMTIPEFKDSVNLQMVKIISQSRSVPSSRFKLSLTLTAVFVSIIVAIKPTQKMHWMQKKPHNLCLIGSSFLCNCLKYWMLLS